MSGPEIREPRLGDSNRPGEAELLKLAMDDPILHAVFKQHAQGLCTYTEALSSVAIVYSKQNAHLMKTLRKLILESPTSIDMSLLLERTDDGR